MHLLKIGEVADLVKLSRPSVYRLIQKAGFPRPLRVGLKAARWRQDEVEDWLASRERGGSEAPEAA